MLKQQLSLLSPVIRSMRAAAIRNAVFMGDLLPISRQSLPLRATWQPGVSVIIPERGTPDLLRRALGALKEALSRLNEASEVIVVVNGAPTELYAELKSDFPGTRWQHHEKPLGFAGAVAEGLALAQYGAAYMHNSDMRIAPDALQKVMEWRAPHVFGIASQIFFEDSGRRREETGWSDSRLDEQGHVQPFERTPEEGGGVRPSLYASGGSSLFDTHILKKFHSLSMGYSPFYWEDLDWGLMAWRHGMEVLFHPDSIAWHLHRGTVSKFYAPEEVDRIILRNALLFRLRHEADAKTAVTEAASGDWNTLKELSKPRTLFEITQVRADLRKSTFPKLSPVGRTEDGIHMRPSGPGNRPLVMIVTPFQILPPRHGGAWRIWRLCEALRNRWRFVLVSDEGIASVSDSWRKSVPFDSVYWVYRRPDGPTDRIGRIRSHSHTQLQRLVDDVAKVRQPAIIHFDHVELAGLRAPAGTPSAITMHDVLVNNQEPEADKFEREAISKFDAVLACSNEDASLLSPMKVDVVPNGAVINMAPTSSAGRRDILFAGPFRYPPNLSGILEFISTVFAPLRGRFPDVRLVILGGDGAKARAKSERLLQHPGVVVEDAVDDVQPWLQRSALTINPLVGIRGSSVKLIESLGAGRICVTTREGARGFVDLDLSSLVVVDQIADMFDPIYRLLTDEPSRLDREVIAREKLTPFSWETSAKQQEQIYERLLGRTGRRE